MNLRFDQPEYWWLALLIIPIILLGWRSLPGMDRARQSLAIAFRCLLIIILCCVLSTPHIDRQHDHLSVIGVVDISESIRRFGVVPANEPAGQSSALEYIRQWVEQTVDQKGMQDRFGLVVFDGEASAAMLPTREQDIAVNLSLPEIPGTDIAGGISLAMGMFPPDTARRLVLISDGNETRGSALEAAQHAAGVATSSGEKETYFGIPIDIVHVDHNPISDVQVVRVEAPASAKPGQTITVRVVLETTNPTTGDLTLQREGQAIDINGTAPGTSRHIQLPAGQSVHLVQVTLGKLPINRFKAIFEPVDPQADALPDNNDAETFTATPSQGEILIVNRDARLKTGVLAGILRRAELPVRAIVPDEMSHDLLSLQNYDLVVLNDVAAHELSAPQHATLSHYVSDLGGGLIMVGGENSFGAGGWNNTAVADILPVELDPPKEIRLPSAALVLVLDKSGSMNQHVAGARATQQEVANEGVALAIESLRRDSLVGVVSFDYFAHEVISLQRNDRPEQFAQRIRGIQAEGGTDLKPGLTRAFNMLRNVEAEKKRIVCLTDGHSETTELDDIVRAMVAHDIKLSTIAVGDAADHAMLEHLADVGQGTYYAVRNPRILPRVLVDSVQVVNKPLIKESVFTPVVLSTGSTLTSGLDRAPPLEGLVITAPRRQQTTTIEMIHPEGEPLLAHWQAGLGRVAAFTSDVEGVWSREWVDWPSAVRFWIQLCRLISRSPMNQDFELITQIEGNQLHMNLEATGTEHEFPEHLRVTGMVYHPDGQSEAVRLQQIGPGRYVGSAPADEAGNYIVALNLSQGEKSLSPVIGGATQTSNPEFRSYESNPALLAEIARITHGRTLDLNNPAATDLFDRANMAPSVSSLPIWQNILWITLGLWLLDVATRRLAWSWAGLWRLVVLAVTRVTPSQVRGQRATATLSSLRRASARFDQQVGDTSPGVEKLESDAEPVLPVSREQSVETGQPSRRTNPIRIGRALQTLLGRRPQQTPDDKSQEPATTEPLAENESREEDEEHATDATSALLAAKRRAREKLDHERES